MVSAYYRRFMSDDLELQWECTLAWTKWEVATSHLLVDSEVIENLEINAYDVNCAKIERWVILSFVKLGAVTFSAITLCIQ